MTDDIAAFNRAGDRSAFARALGASAEGFGPNPFVVSIRQDVKAPDNYIATLLQGGLGMPDRDYYLSSDARLVETRAKYATHVAKMLKLTGIPAAQAATKARNIVALEKKIAEGPLDPGREPPREKTYNKWSAGGLRAQRAGVRLGRVPRRRRPGFAKPLDRCPAQRLCRQWRA